jgi:hypothetical protein
MFTFEAIRYIENCMPFSCFYSRKSYSWTCDQYSFNQSKQMLSLALQGIKGSY